MSLTPSRPAPTEPLEEADPAGLILFHTLGSTQDLTVSVLINGNCNQNGHIFVLAAPVAAQIDAIHIDVRITTALQRAVAPFLNVNIGFLVQLADGEREIPCCPHKASVMSSTRRTETPARYISMSASSTLLSRRRYRSMIAVSNEIPLRRGTLSVTSPKWW